MPSSYATPGSLRRTVALPVRLIVIVGLVVIVAALVGMLFLVKGQGPATSHAAARVADEIKEKTEGLGLKPRTVELTVEKAIKARDAIRRGDFAAARSIAADVVARSRIESWRYHPFDDFIKAVPNVNDIELETQLADWVRQSPDDPIPLVMRAQYRVDLAWFKRGPKFSNETAPQQMAAFHEYMSLAYRDCEAAIRLDPGNPYPFYLKLRILNGYGLTEKMDEAFADAVNRFPDYYPLYVIYLTTLEPKWSGSIAVMYSFVEQHAAPASPDSPLKLLYLTLYHDVLSSAGTACYNNRSDKDKHVECITAYMTKNINANLEQEIDQSLQLYDRLPKYQFGIAVKDLLFDMLGVSGGDAFSGAVLERAAVAMHSNTQLKEDEPNHNNYVIDAAVAESWQEKGFTDNVLTKYQEALEAVKLTEFPDEEARDLALSFVLDRLANIASRQRQYVDTIIYEEAAISFGGRTGNEHYICYGYYNLKVYDEAIRSCTDAADNHGNLPARYWRGRAYRDMGETEAAIRDLKIVADSDHNFRGSAALELSLIYDKQNDFKASLDTLNKYTFLYDPKITSKNNIAAAYNNRCYAYMKLGELQKALDECNASLRYGSLPDAVRKRQELLKLLNPS